MAAALKRAREKVQEDNLIWCDTLSSTPTVGFSLDPHFAPSDVVWNAVTPLLDKLVEGETPKFMVGQSLDPFASTFQASFTADNGFAYGIDSTKVSVGFQHRLRTKQTSGGPPIMEMLSHPLPYTALLDEASRRLFEVTALLPNVEKRSLRRVGILALTVVHESDLPPGLLRFIEYLGRPWKGGMDAFNIQITGQLGGSSGWRDRCIHTLIRPEDPEQLPSVQLDWQRLFVSGRSTSPNSIQEVFREAQKAALRYFEDLAEGNRFDEELIRNTASV